RLSQLAYALIAERAQRGLLTPVRESLVDGLARPLQRPVHRRDARLEGLRRLPGREPEYVTHDQHGALSSRQMLQRSDERKLHRLTLLVSRLGCGVAVHDPERLVWVGLYPYRLDDRLTYVGLRRVLWGVLALER